MLHKDKNQECVFLDRKSSLIEILPCLLERMPDDEGILEEEAKIYIEETVSMIIGELELT